MARAPRARTATALVLIATGALASARAAPPPEAPAEVAALSFVLRRPVDCTPRRARAGRTFLTCSGETRVRLVLAGADVRFEPLEPSREAVVLPRELAAVDRYCPFAPVAALDALPDRFLAYDDPDVGRCYLHAPLETAALDALGAYDRRDHLGTLHPYLAAVMRRALAEAALAGHHFRVISGVRPGGAPSWHTFGLAIDVNLAHRKRLGEATRAYLSGEEREAWLALARAAERLGVYWLGAADPDEIFHFEWRPGWGGLPRGELAAALSADLAERGMPAVWARLTHDPSRPTALGALRDPPPEPAPAP